MKKHKEIVCCPYCNEEEYKLNRIYMADREEKYITCSKCHMVYKVKGYITMTYEITEVI